MEIGSTRFDILSKILLCSANGLGKNLCRGFEDGAGF